MYEELMKENLDLIEGLDTESLFGYLTQNGVLDKEEIQNIKDSHEDKTEVNKALLRHLQTGGGTNHHGLFINALRQTGHLQLANLLETGPRIQPRRWNSLGYLNRTRHKGQICFILQVNALELTPDAFPRRKGLSGISYWIWLEDLRVENKEEEAIHLKTSISQPHLGEKIEKIDDADEETKQSSWCCGCFSKRKRPKNKAKTKAKYKPTEIALEPVVEEQPLKSAPSAQLPIPSDTNPETLDASDSGLENSESEDNLDEIKMKAEILHDKSSKFYQLLLDLEGQVRQRLLQYFEQTRKILILDVLCEDGGIILVCISTKLEQLMELQEDFLHGQLVQDLEDTLINDDVKRFIMVKGMKLQLSVDEEEFPKAIVDLDEC